MGNKIMGFMFFLLTLFNVDFLNSYHINGEESTNKVINIKVDDSFTSNLKNRFFYKLFDKYHFKN